MNEKARSTAPAWYWVVATIGLFIRRSWSISLFGVCLAAVLVQMIFTMVLLGGLQTMGPSGLAMPSLVIVLTGTFLWFSYFAKKNGWLG